MKNPITTLSLTTVAAIAMVSGVATAQMNPQPPVMPNMPAPPPTEAKPPMPDAAPPPPPAAESAPPSAETMPPCSKTVHDNCTTKSGKVKMKHHPKMMKPA